MRLKVLLPSKVFLDTGVHKVVAEGQDGSFGLLPAHVDMVAALVPGILSYVTEKSGRERFLGLDRGVLVKTGSEVLVSVRNAVIAERLGELRRTVEEQFMVQDEREKKVRSSMARLEAGFARKFLEYQKNA